MKPPSMLQVGIRAELKAGKTRRADALLHASAAIVGRCDQAGAHVDRNKKIGNTFAEYREEG